MNTSHEALFRTVVESQAGSPALSLRAAYATVAQPEHRGPVSTYVNRTLCAALIQHEGSATAAEDMARDLEFAAGQIAEAARALRLHVAQ
jgi:hypothetical protein